MTNSTALIAPHKNVWFTSTQLVGKLHNQSYALIFVHSLKGAAFTKTRFCPHIGRHVESILALLISCSENKVSIIDLADTRQKPDEDVNELLPVRSLNLQYSDKLIEQPYGFWEVGLYFIKGGFLKS